MLIDTADEESLKARTGAESESKMKKREDEELALAKEKDGKDLSPKELEVLECLWSAKKAKSVPKIVKLLREKTDQEYAESTVRTFLTRIEKKGYVARNNLATIFTKIIFHFILNFKIIFNFY